MTQVASALREAHALGLVHRDIKPANVVLCERGGVQDVAKVVDFGLVRIASGADATVSAGNIIGTPLYLAPEAISDPDRVDARSDLYACGAVAYFLLTGHPVFEAPSLVEVCSHHLYTAPQAPSARLGRELPGSLDAVELRCLAKAPELRFQSAAELGQALATCGSADWTEADALLAWQRVGGCHPQLTATARTLPADSASPLAIDLRRRGQAGS